MAVQQPLSARENRTLKAAGSVQVGAATPRTRNPLLMRDDVGRARPTCYDLPETHFAYGRPGNQDVEGAREVSMRWVSHMPSRGPQDDPPDFVFYNKKAAGQKILTAKDQGHFRREHDLPQGASPSGRGYQTARARYHSMFERDAVPSDVVLGFAYGRKVRPSTPIHSVISNHFGTQAEQAMGRFYTDFRDAQDQASTHVRKIPLTAASRGHASGAKKAAMLQDGNGELFKMSKFKRASPKVDTRHRRQRDILDRYHDDDSDIGEPLTRQGVPLQGGDYQDSGSRADAAPLSVHDEP
mmetsp:Transcript_80501/g.249766  ORF Transcript_80501/g.249766 Transcript_80501/m.249766 type:complete len:297 (+) Transcript_80501:52-942(+)